MAHTHKAIPGRDVERAWTRCVTPDECASPRCRSLARSKSVSQLLEREAIARGLKPCRNCHRATKTASTEAPSI